MIALLRVNLTNIWSDHFQRLRPFENSIVFEISPIFKRNTNFLCVWLGNKMAFAFSLHRIHCLCKGCSNDGQRVRGRSTASLG